MKICIYSDPGTRRSREIAIALRAGVAAMGWQGEIVHSTHTVPRADVIAAYGWCNQRMFEAYRKTGRHYVYVDLGYWARKRSRNDYAGYHKAVVDARHATKYFRRARPGDRLIGVPRLEPWKNGGGPHIIVAGMSAKGAAASGLRPLEWETATIARLRELTTRRIIYRPKPSWRDARPLPGALFSPGTQPIAEVLREAHALVTYHSNAAIDALAAGIPVHAADGLASVMSMPSLDCIEAPPRDGDRGQFFADVGYCHWTVPEMADGTMWGQMREDGLLPC